MQELEAIPALNDNYVWCLHDGRQALIVDPGEAEPVLKWLQDRQLLLTAILITHHHPDHIGGLPALRRHWPQSRSWGPVDARIPDLDHTVNEGDRIELASPNVALKVTAVPGHTLSHIAYHNEDVLFCGDTLFSAGCGRLFEGTPSQMNASLTRLARLPDTIRICCGHEYTEANIRFARQVEPENPDLVEYAMKVRKSRANGQPSLPSTMAVERRVNPFLRSDEATVRRALQRERGLAEHAGPDHAFAELRAWKDGFRG